MFFNDTATTEIYTLSLHDALPISCTQAIMTHGGMGYAKEFHVERLLREVLITRLAPISPQLILCNIAEKALGLPKSY